MSHPTQSSTPPATPPTADHIGSTFVNWETLAAREIPVGLVRPIFDGPTPTMERFELHATTLKPGLESHPPHHHAREEILLVKEGQVEIEINGRSSRPPAGSWAFIASHDVHAIRNVGPAPATYYSMSFETEDTAKVRDFPAAESAPAGMLRSTVLDWDKLDPQRTKYNDVRRFLVDSPTLTFNQLEVHATTHSPGNQASWHAGHLWLLVIFIKESVLEYCVDNVTCRVGPGSIVYMAPGAVHTVRNVGSVPSVYYVMAVSSSKTPKG